MVSREFALRAATARRSRLPLVHTSWVGSADSFDQQVIGRRALCSGRRVALKEGVDRLDQLSVAWRRELCRAPYQVPTLNSRLYFTTRDRAIGPLSEPTPRESL